MERMLAKPYRSPDTPPSEKEKAWAKWLKWHNAPQKRGFCDHCDGANMASLPTDEPPKVRKLRAGPLTLWLCYACFLRSV